MIVDYDPRWPAEYERIAQHLRAGLGNLALRVDHIGSTSVPGLAAKDVIDIQVSAAALDEDLRAAMLGLGYEQPLGTWTDHQPPGGSSNPDDWTKFLFREQPGQRRANIHVRLWGRANSRYPLLFRDYLRAHPATAAAYAELKRQLAANLADWQTYPDVKDPAVDLIYLAAEDWAKAAGWQAD